MKKTAKVNISQSRTVASSLVGLSLLMLSSLGGPVSDVYAEAAGPAEPAVLNGIVAAVDGRALTLLDLKKFRRINEPFVPPGSDTGFMTFLNGLIETEMLKEEFSLNSISAGDADVETYIDRLLAQNGQSQETIRAALKEYGLTWSDYFERMRQEVQRLALINTVIRSRVSVSNEDVERAWASDPKFLDPPKIEISHIYLPFPRAASQAERAVVRARANEVYSEVENGRGFPSAARKYSKGPTSDEGGALGAFTSGSMASHFEDAVENLKEGEVSKPIETPDGVHIVRLDKELPSVRRPYDEVAESLREELYEKRLNERFERWASVDLREKHFIEMKLENLALSVAS
jgi:peptidyl-prolyl cis-trans isomerase SurA